MTWQLFRRCCLSPASFLPAVVVLLLAPCSTFGQQGAQGDGDAIGEKANGEFTLRGQRAAKEIRYGDWEKFCFKVPGTTAVCRTTVSGRFETGQRAVRIDLIEKEGEGVARVQMFLPVGMYLQSGVKLTIDQGTTYRVPYVWCLTNTCIAAAAADPMLIQDMERGQKLSLDLVDSSVLAVSTSVPLHQFGTVRHGAPARTFEQAIDE
jgi:invasion protein IalB